MNRWEKRNHKTIKHWKNKNENIFALWAGSLGIMVTLISRICLFGELKQQG